MEYIIETFKKSYYLFHRICSKDELIKETNNIISSTDLLLSNHFRGKIQNYLGWNESDSLSHSSLNTFDENDLEDLKIEFENKQKD